MDDTNSSLPTKDSAYSEMGKDPYDGEKLGEKGIACSSGGKLIMVGEFTKSPFTSLTKTTKVNDTIIYVQSGLKF